jgi:PAS domain S-box-containing protein
MAGRGVASVRRVGCGLCVGGATIAALGLSGAFAGAGALTSTLPGMTANSALTLLLIGVAAVLREREGVGPAAKAMAMVAAVAALAIAAATLVENALPVDLRIDHLLHLLPNGLNGSPRRRPSLPTALALTCLGGAAVAFDARATARGRPSEWLALAAGFTGLTAVLGFAFDAELRFPSSRAPLVGTSLPTAVALLLTAIGMLLGRTDAGLMRVAVSRGPGGRQLRRFVLPAAFLPVALGLLVILPLRAIDRQALSAVVAVLASAMIAIGLLVLTMTAVSLNRTYDALESSRAHTRALVEQAPDGVFIADLRGRYTDVNSAGCGMLGYTRDEMLTKSVTDLVPPSEVARMAETRVRLLDGESGVSQWTWRKKDGSYLPVEVNAKIFPDGRWQALVRDISGRMRLERVLRAAEAEQKFLADLGSALVATIDDRETVQLVARSVVAQLADVCSVETLDDEGRMRARVVAHRDPDKAAVARRLEALQMDSARPYLGSTARETRRPQLVSTVSSSYLDGFAHSVEHRRVLRELDPKSFMAVPLLAHGGVVGSLVFISTTEGRHYTEADLPFAEAVAVRAALAVEKASLYRIAQQAIKLRDDVLSIVAHDLRNPLGTILMQAGLLRRHHAETDPRVRKPSEAIERAARRMNRLIQDLLDVARMEGGRLSVEQGRVSVRQAVADAMHALEPLAAAASLGLRLDVPRGLPEVWADRDRLLQIFENLIGNAVKFSHPGGHVTVGAAPRDSDVLFWVADAGPGIAAADLPHVFERLWQAEKARHMGAGLGLPIVKGIVEAHGGHVWVESAPGQGTTFFFTIPTAPGAAPWHAEPARQGA